MRDRLEELAQADRQLLAVDPHESWSVKALLDEVGFRAGDVKYLLLADPACIVSATYGVAFQMWIHTEISARSATFLIDRDGTLRYARRAKTFNDRPTPDEIIAELKKL